MGLIVMNTRERRRMALMSRVTEGMLRLREAAAMMRLSYRQARRIRQRYELAGDTGLVHQGRGRRSNRARPAQERERALGLYAKRYKGFGPLLAIEHLEKDHGLKVGAETFRQWLVGAGYWTVRTRRLRHRAARERRPRRGDLVQIDGSEHDWLEGRGPRLVLMVMIDDATNTTLARFYEAEDTEAAFDIFERYVGLYGLPLALYPDRDSIYVCTREARLDEELAHLGPQTQFARAMRELGVDLFCAYSPQAKGRVERRHGLFQDRLVKEMRLLGICSKQAANAYLDETFLELVNERYTVASRDSANGHQPRPSPATLALALSWQQPRMVGKDWTVRWCNRWLQIDVRHARLGLPGRRVQVVEKRDGSLAMVYEGCPLSFHSAPPPAPKAAQKPPLRSVPRKSCIPAADHPWRRSAVARRPDSRLPPTSYMAHSREAGIRTSRANVHATAKG